jgi:hypothetical protein
MSFGLRQASNSAATANFMRDQSIEQFKTSEDAIRMSDRRFCDDAVH